VTRQDEHTCRSEVSTWGKTWEVWEEAGHHVVSWVIPVETAREAIRSSKLDSTSCTIITVWNEA